MARSDKKQRNKARREAKRRDARRKASQSPIKRFAEAKGEIDVYMVGDFHGDRQVQIIFYKRTAMGNILATFLVDRGVVGLKDAWAKPHCPPDELDMILRQFPTDLQGRRTTVDDAVSLLRSAVRFTVDNGMRLPKDLDKATSIFGGLGDWRDADTSQFIMEFAGHPEDLRQRLVTSSFEDYIQRKDVSFIFSDTAPYMDQATGEYYDTDAPNIEEDLANIADEIVDSYSSEDLEKMRNLALPSAITLCKALEQDLKAHNQTPRPQLREACQTVLLATLISAEVKDIPTEYRPDLCSALIDALASRISEDDAVVEEHFQTISQVLNGIKRTDLLNKVGNDKEIVELPGNLRIRPSDEEK